MTDDKEYDFHDLPTKVQQQIVDSIDPYDIYDEGWFNEETGYFKEWFNELLSERLGNITPANYEDIRFDQPRGQGPYYAYVDAEMGWGVEEIRLFIETSDTLKQNGIVNATLQLFEADKMAYGKSVVAPLMGGAVPFEHSLSFSFTLSPSYLNSGQVSYHTSYDNFPLEMKDFEMRYRGETIGQGVFHGGWDSDGKSFGQDVDVYDELTWAVVNEQVKPVYMWVEYTLKPVFYEWFIGVLEKMGEAMTKQSDYQVSKERVWDYLDSAEKTYNIEGEEL